MNKQEDIRSIIQIAISRMRERSRETFRSQWPFWSNVHLSGRNIASFAGEAKTWLNENCSGRWVLRLDIEAVGFIDEADAVAFTLFSAP